MINFRTNPDLKLVLALVVILMTAFTVTVYAQTSHEFGYRLIPGKIVENTEGILQIYVDDQTSIQQKIENLVVTTSDSSIIEILEIEKSESEFATNVKIKATGAGTATISIAAPGFSSQEIPITVYSNKHNPTRLLVKATPDTFSINGPTKGYVSVELADKDGFPTEAVNDVAITLTTSLSDVIDLKNKDLLIKKGEYFVITEFETNHADNVQVYASAQNMETGSAKVSVNKADEPLTIQLFVYPQKINSFYTSHGYAIVQLQDASGNPVKAKDDINVSLKITDPNLETVNTSGQFPGISTGTSIEIKKGTYYGYSKVVVRSGLEGTYDVSISAKDYLVSTSGSLQVVDLELLDDKSIRMDMLPVLADGQKELIGIIHLEEDGNPVAANKDLLIKMDSSDESMLSISDTLLNEGEGTALVFGKVGYTQPDTLTLNLVNEKDRSYSPEIVGPAKSSLSMIVEPIITKVLANTDFPLILHMSENGESRYFPEDREISISQNEFIQIQPKMIKRGESVLLFDSKSLKPDSATVEFEAGDFSTEATIDNLSSKPAAIDLNYPDTILSNIDNVFSIQILDAQELPVFADIDMELKIVSNDPTMLSVPENVIIKKGDYYTNFVVTAKKSGSTDLTILTSELPLSKFTVNVQSLTPELSIDSFDHVNPDADFDVTVIAQYHGSPLSGLGVEWTVNGAAIKNSGSITNEDGKAILSLHSQDPSKVDVQASVSGGVYSTVIVNKQITINPPLESPPTPKTETFSLMGINPIFLILPVAAAVAVIILKKKNMLDGITEKVNFVEKISDIKEKIFRFREK